MTCIMVKVHNECSTMIREFCIFLYIALNMEHFGQIYANRISIASVKAMDLATILIYHWIKLVWPMLIILQYGNKSYYPWQLR